MKRRTALSIILGAAGVCGLAAMDARANGPQAKTSGPTKYSTTNDARAGVYRISLQGMTYRAAQ